MYNSPSLTHTKIGTVLHLQWTEEDGSKFLLDVDVNCPNMKMTGYDGGILGIQEYLRTNTPVGWVEEFSKLDDMHEIRNFFGVKPSVRVRLISRETVLARQVSCNV